MSEASSEPTPHARTALAAVTRGIVKIHAEYFGKGPMRARTDRFGDDGVICVLRETLTSVEETLIDRGRAEQVIALRRSFQDVMEPEMREVVEEALGRPVVAFLSQVHLDPDLATEIFFLGPAAEATEADGG